MNVSFTNKRYNELKPDLDMIDKIFRGFTEIKKSPESFIFRDPKESDEHYKNRLKRVRFENYLFRSINNINSLIFRKDYELELPLSIQKLESNSDGEGTSLKHSLITHSRNALKHGVSFILVDFIDTSKFKNKMEFNQSGALPTLKNIDKKDILNFRTGVSNGQKYLTQVTIKQSVELEINDFETTTEDVYIVLNINKGTIYRKKEDTFEVISRWENKLGYIPLFATYSNKLGFFDSDLPFFDLMQMNLNLMNIVSDDTMIRAQASRPIKAVFGYLTDGNPDDKEREIVLGLDDALDFGTKLKSDAGVEIISLPSDIVKVNEKSIDDLKTDIDKFSLSILSNQTYATATEAQIHSKNSSLFLVELSESLDSTTNKVIKCVLDFMGSSEDFVFNINKDFEGTELSPEKIQKLIDLKNEGIISVETVFSKLKKGEVINSDLDYKDEQKKINEESEGL